MPAMMVAQVATDGLYAVSVAIVVAVIYLLIVRLLDLNEKEPMWAVGLVFEQGFVVGLLLPLVVSPVTLELDQVLGPLVKEVALFVAVGVGVAILAVVAQQRGWSELSGPMDGIVYGATAGFGFAVGAALAREFTFAESAARQAAGTAGAIGGTALAGLSLGLFGAIIGIGFAAGLRARSGAARFLWPIVGLAAAFGAHLLYQALARGGAVGGSSARTWIALAIPAVLVVVVLVAALSRERRAIRDELGSELETGGVTDRELVLLNSFGARRGAYAGAFFRGDFDHWLAIRTLHNRQVQLALAKQRLARESDPDSRAELEAEIDRLRASAVELRAIAEARRGRRAAG